MSSAAVLREHHDQDQGWRYCWSVDLQGNGALLGGRPEAGQQRGHDHRQPSVVVPPPPPIPRPGRSRCRRRARSATLVRTRYAGAHVADILRGLGGNDNLDGLAGKVTGSTVAAATIASSAAPAATPSTAASATTPSPHERARGTSSTAGPDVTSRSRIDSTSSRATAKPWPRLPLGSPACTSASTPNTRYEPIENVVIVAEEMLRWLREIDGFDGFLMLHREGTFIGLNVGRAATSRTRSSRPHAVPRSLTTSVADVQVEEVTDFQVAFAEFGPRLTSFAT